MKKILGLTLIECMIALTLSIIILSTLISIFLAAENSFQHQVKLSQVQENAQIAIKLVHNDLSMAGYLGCPRLTMNFPLTNLTGYDLTPLNKIVFTNSTVGVWHASLNHNNLIETMRDNSTLYTTSNYVFSDHDILIISDCQSAAIFQAKKHVGKSHGLQKIISSEPLATRYEKNAEISKLEMNNYFVSTTERYSRAGLPIYALYRSDIHHRKTELVEGVESMEIHPEPNRAGISIVWMVTAENLKKKWFSYISL